MCEKKTCMQKERERGEGGSSGHHLPNKKDPPPKKKPKQSFPLIIIF